jgi:rRNA maturation RNase YbeY
VKLNNADLTARKILIINDHPNQRIPFTKKFIAGFALNLIKKEKKKLNLLMINFVDDKYIKTINKKYLGHNYYTDIITFDYSENAVIEGEIFISIDTIRKNTKLYTSTFKDELLRVIAHGCLHLSGYNDITKKDKELIRNKENFYLNN